MSTPEETASTENGWRDVSVTLDSAVKKTWRLDGMLHRVVEAAGHALDKVRSLADRGPDPDYSESEFERGVKIGARYGGYREAPKNGGTSWHKAILTIACGVALAGILGGVAMYGKLSAVEANLLNQQKQLDNLTQMVLNLTRRPQ